MLYFVLLLLLICGVCFEWKTNEFEIVSPVSLMLLGLALANVLAMMGRGSWNSYGLSLRVFSILIMGSIALLGGSFIACRLNHFGGLKRIKAIELPSKIAVWKYLLLLILVLIAIALRVSETYRLALELGVDGGSYSAAAKAVRSAYASFNSSDGMLPGQGFSFLSKQMTKVESCITYLSVFLLARAFVYRNRKEIVASFVLVSSCCCYVIISGSRGELLYQGIAFAVILYVFLLRRGHSAKKLTLLFFFVGVVLGVVLSVGFWLSSALVGRKSNSGFIEYITFYFGCGLPSLESILQSNSLADVFPGVRTFYYLFALPFKFGLIDNYPSYSIAWVNLGGHASNIFTGFARFYLDFGMAGLVVLSCASGFLLTLLYRQSKVTSGWIFIILTGYFCAQCFDFAREEFLFSRFLSTSSAVWLVLLVALTWFMTTDFSALWSRLVERFAKERN